MTRAIAEIRTSRCRIAPLREGDARAVQAITDTSVTSRIHFLPEPFTMADAEALILNSDQEHRFLGIWDGAASDLRGVIGAHMRDEREIEVGYWLDAGARGKGIATEALGAVLSELAFRHPECRIVAECDPDNGPSWAVLDRVGFIPTGRAGKRPGRCLLSWVGTANYRIDVC